MKLGDLRGEPRDLARKLIGTFLLWLPFSVAAVAAIPLCLAATWLEQWAYAKAVIAAMDRLAAAVLGWGGDYTVSAECGSRHKDCRFCRLVCRLLDLVQPGHCAGAAAHEQLATTGD